MVIIVMGVSGAGKTTIGSLLARRLNWIFRDGDEFHPSANVDKMKSGIPLTDTDRGPWLNAIHEFAVGSSNGGQSAVIACSALKEEYRQTLRGSLKEVLFVHLAGSPELLAQRIANRTDHFMPPTLLSSQLATLEAPSDAMVIDIVHPPEEIVGEIIQRMRIAGSI